MMDEVVSIQPEAYDPAMTFFKIYAINKCNFNCPYCYNEQSRSDKILDLDLMAKHIQGFKEQSKRKVQAALIGGETTLHPQLLSFCKKMQQIDVSTVVFTNMSNMECARALLDVGTKLIVSWHGNNFNKTFIERFAQFSECDYKQLVVRIMFEPEHQEESLQTYFEMKKRFQSFKNYEFSVVTDNENYKKSKEYDPSLFAKYEEIANSLDTTNIKIKTATSKEKIVQDDYFFGHQKERTNFKNWICNAGIEFLYVHVDGSVCTCPECLSAPLANIYTTAQILPAKHPVICKKSECSCAFYIKKRKLIANVHA